MFNKENQSRVISSLVSLCLVMVMCSPFVYASDLNGVSTNSTTVETVTSSVPTTTVPENTTPQTNQSSSGSNPISSAVGEIPATTQKESVNNTANAVSNMFNNAGPKQEHIEVANEFIAPIANIMNTAMAVILGATSLLMMFTTVLDLLYIAFPPVRDMLDGGRSGMANMQGGRGMGGSRGMGGMRGGYGMGGMRGGYGMGGMNSMGMGGMNSMGMGGMNGMGGPGMGGGMQQPQQMGGGLSAVGRWVSDEAVAACMETQGGIMQGQQMGMGLPVKSMVFSYIKKRSMFLILFGVCVVLFTSTVFTDLGIRLGTWILNLILGFGA
jgi:hypothetical protein